MIKQRLSLSPSSHSGPRWYALRAAALACLFWVALPSLALAQAARTVTGTVTDASGALVGATVVIKGTATGTTTDAGGGYSIQAPSGATLVFSCMGYASQQIAPGDKTRLDVRLETDTKAIDEVVVVGYGVQKKSLVTGAISQVKGDALEKTGIVNAGDALAGKVAGVQVLSDNGQPGAGVQITVRGIGTNNSKGANPIYIVDGMDVDGISYLNPADIESMEILKDAAAAAIYGARGGNGVVLITTKKGKEGTSSINFSYSYGISNIPAKLSLLTAHEYAIIRNEMSVNAGNAPQFTDDQINSYGQGTDWQEAILYRNAPTQQYNLSFLGGSARSSYALSGSYLDQNGIIAQGKSNYKRFTATFKGEQKFLRGDVLRVGQNVVLSRVISKDITANSIMGGPITFALNMDPLTPVYDDYTKYSDYGTNQDYYDLYHGYAYSRYVGSDYNNPAALIHFSNPNSHWTTAKANVYAELTILKDLKLRGSLGGDMTWRQEYSYTAPRRFNPTTYYNTTNSTSQSSSERQTVSGDAYATWAKIFCRKHDVSVMGGMQMLSRSALTLSGSRDGLPTTDIEKAYVSLAKGANQTASGGPDDDAAYRLLSFFARANYAYDNRYLLTATIRRDGSSNFGANNRFATFPSVSVGWNISNEHFMGDVKWMDVLKLRASWGQNGNDNIDPFLYMSLIQTSSQMGYVFGSNTATAVTPGGGPTRLSNPDLKWEAVEQLNFGLDATLFENWSLTVDYYRKTTRDQLVYTPVRLTFGRMSPLVNAGDVLNRGVEFMLEYRKTFANKLSLSASGNVSFNKNEVRYVGTETGFVQGATVNGIGDGSTEITRMEVGYPMAYFRGLKTGGVFQNWEQIRAYTWTDPSTGVAKMIQPNAVPGDLIYLDWNNDGVIDSHDYTMIGNPYPKVIYGFNVNVAWKNFDLTVNTAGAAGHQVFSSVRRNQSPNNWGAWAIGRWTGEGTSYTIPRLTDSDTNGNWKNPSELFIQDADFFRIRNVALGYTFNFSPKYYVQKFRVFASVNNLVTFTKYDRGYDPEIGSSNPLSRGVDMGNYPRPRMVNFGANLTF